MERKTWILSGSALSILVSVVTMLPLGGGVTLPTPQPASPPPLAARAGAASPVLTGQAGPDYGADQAFLDEVLRLKKQKVLAGLQNDISKLAPDQATGETHGSHSALPPVVSPPPPPPSAMFTSPGGVAPTAVWQAPRLLAINPSQGVAMLQGAGQVIRARVGDHIGSAVLVAVQDDAVALRHDGETQWIYPSNGEAQPSKPGAQP